MYREGICRLLKYMYEFFLAILYKLYSFFNGGIYRISMNCICGICVICAFTRNPNNMVYYADKKIKMLIHETLYICIYAFIMPLYFTIAASNGLGK